MNLIGQNGTFIIVNADNIILTANIKNNIAEPFITKMSKVAIENIRQLLFEKLKSVDLNFKSTFTSNACIDDNFSCFESFFIKMPLSLNLSISDFDAYMPFIIKFISKSQGFFNINLTELGIDFDNCQLENGNYIISIFDNDTGNVFKKNAQFKYCYHTSHNLKFQNFNSAIINSKMFIHSTTTNRIFRKLLIKTNVFGEIGEISNIQEETALKEIQSVWPEINLTIKPKTPIKINNINSLLLMHMDNLERQLFIEENKNTEFIIQCECLLNKPKIRTAIVYTKI